jgi:hypothetical protein
MLTAFLGYAILVLFFGLEFFVRKGDQARSFKAGHFDRNTTILIGASYPISILLPPILNYFNLGSLSHAGLAGAIGFCLMLLGLGIRF